MKKVLLLLLMAVVSLGASAQFEKGTKYVNVGLSGLGLSYNDNTKFCVGIGATGGYFVANNWMLKGTVQYDRQYENNSAKLNAGFRYYIKSNGIFTGAGLQYQYNGASFVQLTPEVGYCYYVNHYLSIEPSLYFDVCLNNFKAGTAVGLKIAAGFYF